METGDGNTISDQKGILQKVKRFYENLYCHKDVADIDLNQLLPDAPILSNDDCDSLEGPIPYQEAVYVLENMKNFKNLGPDGFTTEFFRFSVMILAFF